MDFQAIINSRKVQLLTSVVFLSLLLIFFRGGVLSPLSIAPNLGIEFVGGVQIPITLQQAVDPTTMQSMVSTIELRINGVGLSQANVQSVGNNEILVEIPQAGPGAIAAVENILSQQGQFEAVIDGQQALNGSDVLANSVGGSNNEAVTATSTGYSWELGFAATTDGAQKFANAANGKAYYPVYMFLDRPTNAAILLEQSWYNQSGPIQLLTTALQNAAHENGNDIQIIWLDDWSNASLNTLANVSTVIVDSNLSQRRPQIYNQLLASGFAAPGSNATRVISEKNETDLIAATYTSQQNVLIVDSWPAIGLLSGPTLDPGLANGYVSQFYQITGTGSGNTPQEQQANALSELENLKVVLSSGRLPVSTYIGSSYSVDASLGKQFLVYSVVGLALAIIIVGLLIVIRYRHPALIVPIMLVDLCEVLITIAIVGTFGTLDLAAAAGIITLIGTAVDNQIIITDELLHKRGNSEEEIAEHGLKEKLGRAFHIVFTTAGIAIVAMLPLLLSGIVEITGFALSTIIGILVGVLITRPGFGKIVGEMYRE
jgi:preprotein translocase subunit SecD